MALRLMTLNLLKRAAQQSGVRGTHYENKIGNREVVGFGINGFPVYADTVAFPMPAIRFREDTPEIKVLREKEKGDWNKLSIHEKKALYRASFCQTFAEMRAPTGDWKPAISAALIATSLSLIIAMLVNVFVYDERPHTFSEENQKAQLKRMLDLEMHPIHGISSKWDYENKRWK